MTDLLAQPATLPSLSPLGLRRARARRAADRHSLLVKVLRRTIVVGALLAAAGLGLAILRPFHAMPGLTVAGTAVDGTKVTMDTPKLAGVGKDGRPYVIEAARAVQDLKVPSVFDLFDLRAHFASADRHETRLTAEAGTYNTAADTMNLTRGAHVRSDSGFDAVTETAMVTFKDNSLVTDKPVVVSMPGRRITADGMRIVEGGRQITFDGHVRSTFEQGQDGASASETGESQAAMAPVPAPSALAPSAPAP